MPPRRMPRSPQSRPRTQTPRSPSSRPHRRTAPIRPLYRAVHKVVFVVFLSMVVVVVSCKRERERWREGESDRVYGSRSAKAGGAGSIKDDTAVARARALDGSRAWCSEGSGFRARDAPPKAGIENPPPPPKAIVVVRLALLRLSLSHTLPPPARAPHPEPLSLLVWANPPRSGGGGLLCEFS